mgnify:FL=1
MSNFHRKWFNVVLEVQAREGKATLWVSFVVVHTVLIRLDHATSMNKVSRHDRQEILERSSWIICEF